jgi:sensor c-di-GMP phosphodiesterase-like protein
MANVRHSDEAIAVMAQQISLKIVAEAIKAQEGFNYLKRL